MNSRRTIQSKRQRYRCGVQVIHVQMFVLLSSLVSEASKDDSVQIPSVDLSFFLNSFFFFLIDRRLTQEGTQT